MWWRTPLGSLVAMQLLTRLRIAGDLEPGFAGYHTGRSLSLARFGLILATLLRTLAGYATRACLAIRIAGYSDRARPANGLPAAASPRGPAG